MRNLILFAAVLVLFSCKKPNDNTSPGSASFTALYNFNDTLGASPQGDLIVSGNTLYGMTSAGGSYGYGVIFSFNLSTLKYTDMHDFAGYPNDGETPYGDLTLIGGTLYGMTHQGGANSTGVLFSMNVGGGGFNVLYNFGGGTSDTTGVYPNGSLTSSGTMLYGMTSEGGVDDGNIFSFNTNGNVYTDLYDFPGNGKNGVYPGGNLTLSNNVLYGMAYLGGGSNNDGVIFSFNLTNSTFSKLYTFTGSNGANPEGSLLLIGSTLYGMTNAGGANSGGNIFSINTSGSGFNDLYDFNSSTGPAAPWGTLIASGNTLYGMATSGADIGGYVFSIPASGGSLTDVYSFNLGNNGSSPYGAVLQYNGLLYGMTNAGGKYSYGTIFSCKP